MNTMGRILVILNLLFALFVGGFLVVDFATRKNWKDAYETLKQSVEIAKQNHAVAIKERNKHVRDLQIQQATIKDLEQKLSKVQADGLDKRNSLEAENKKTQATIRNAALGKTSAEQQAAGSLTLVQDHQTELAKKNNQIKDLGGLLDKERSKVQEAEAAMNAALDRQRELLRRVGELTAKLADYETEIAKAKLPGARPGTPQSPAIEIVRGGRSNPPKAFLEGKVTQVGPGSYSTYALVDLGSDDNLAKGNTLYVYRTDKVGSQVRYIGELEITALKAHVAAGKMLPRSNGRSPSVKVGDFVTSNLNP
ncbi:MAG: hypothetical protein ACFCD0_18960 [Gemmataceae bacterium]